MRLNLCARPVLWLLLSLNLALPVSVHAAAVALATSPLATSTTSAVKPNVFLVMDNSGSMDWDHMPDSSGDGGSAVTFNFGYYGLRSSQCNMVYYDPSTTYLPPAYADGTSYPNSSFTAAWDNGYGGTNGAPGGATTDLSTSFQASSSKLPDTINQPAYYYTYSGAQTTQLQKNYNSPSNTFYAECNNSTGGSGGSVAPASGVGGFFTKHTVSATSSPTATDERTNFANWYSYYRTRLLMMKTATGLAFKNLDKNYRVGFMKISSSGTPTTYVDTFWDNNDSTIGALSTQRTGWYKALYTTTTSGSTPLRTALSDAGRYYAGVLYTIGSTKPDPVQYSCQQNFTILSTDGYWNTGAGYDLNGNAVGNQDGTAARPMNDGTTLAQRSTSQLTRSTSQLQIRTQQQQQVTSVLQSSTSNLQQSAWQLQYQTTKLQQQTIASAGAPWTTWTNVSSCQWATSYPKTSCRYSPTASDISAWTNGSCTINDQSANSSNGTLWTGDKKTCQYASPATVTNVSSCVISTKSTGTTNGTVYNINAVTSCNYSAYSAPATVSSCTPVVQSAASPYAGPAVTCSYAAQTPTNVSSCTPVAQSGFSVAPVTCPVTDSGWSATNSCAASTSNGQTVSCKTVTTGPTGGASCSPASATSGNSYTATTCNTITTGPTDVSSCTASSASSTNSYTATTCTGTVSGGSSDSLADVAMYYYQTDLRAGTFGTTPACSGALGTDVCQNNVFISTSDNNTQQHMTTFTLGLGASGWMNYSSSYSVDGSGDYYSVKNGSLASSTASPPVCSWQTNGTKCNWPTPGMSGSNGLIANIDDLWHAAINGRGAYYSATNPTTLSAGLVSALAGINSRKGAAAAAATSTLNPVSGNNSAYVASYTTVAWTGNLEQRGVNISTGAVSRNAGWCVEDVVAESCPSPGAIFSDTSGGTTTYDCVTPNVSICTGGYLVAAGTVDVNNVAVPPGCHMAVATACSGKLKTQVGALSDTRNIYTPNSAGTALTPFLYANLSNTSQGNFAASHINTLSQWSSLTSSQQASAAGADLVNYLRGQKDYEFNVSTVANRLYRSRDALLGDALESQPTYVGPPVYSYPYPGYSSFASSHLNRASVVYMGANDGMLHAFSGSTGLENWAYVPSVVIPNMWKLADTNYATSHVNFVNGSVTTTDVCTANCDNTATAVWKTILVGGLNGGGRAYYALDITNPLTPVLLWEFTPATDSDLGYSFGVPVITRKTDGTWVVLLTSGYDNGTVSSNPTVNNSPAGSGGGFLYVLDASTGVLLSKISTGAGNAASPSGLAKIASWNNEPAGNTAGYVYGGDLLGNLWRFDINLPSHTTGSVNGGSVMKLASLFSDTAGTLSQPIMTTPILGNINNKRVVFVGTGKYLEAGDLSAIQTQTQYAIMDDDATTTLVNPRTSLTAQILTAAGATRSVTNNSIAFSATNRGWYVDLPDSGERVSIDAKLVQGTLVVPTIVPSNTVCSPGGYAWLNYFNYKTGGSLMPDANGTTGAASTKYDATIVGINVVYINGKPKLSVGTSNDPTPTPDPSVPFLAGGGGYTGKRVLWRELIP